MPKLASAVRQSTGLSSAASTQLLATIGSPTCGIGMAQSSKHTVCSKSNPPEIKNTSHRGKNTGNEGKQNLKKLKEYKTNNWIQTNARFAIFKKSGIQIPKKGEEWGNMGFEQKYSLTPFFLHSKVDFYPTT